MWGDPNEPGKIKRSFCKSGGGELGTNAVYATGSSVLHLPCQAYKLNGYSRKPEGASHKTKPNAASSTRYVVGAPTQRVCQNKIHSNPAPQKDCRTSENVTHEYVQDHPFFSCARRGTPPLKTRGVCSTFPSRQKRVTVGVAPDFS